MPGHPLLRKVIEKVKSNCANMLKQTASTSPASTSANELQLHNLLASFLTVEESAALKIAREGKVCVVVSIVLCMHSVATTEVRPALWISYCPPHLHIHNRDQLQGHHTKHWTGYAHQSHARLSRAHT